MSNVWFDMDYGNATLISTPVYEPITPGIITSGNHSLRLQNSVLICTYTSSILSIIGSIIIFVTYCTVPAAKNQTRRLLLYLTISDLLTCVGNLLGTIRYNIKHQNDAFVSQKTIHKSCIHPDDICTTQSFLTTFSSMASFSWTIIIGLHILLTLVYQTEWCFKLKAKVLAHCVSWGIPLTITLVAAFNNVLGEDFNIGSGPWCWIRGCLHNDEDANRKTIVMWMAITGKGWEILTYLVTAALYINLKIYMIRLRRRRKSHVTYSQISDHLRDEDEIYVLVWFVLVILRLSGTIRFFIAVGKIVSNEVLIDFSEIDKVLLHMQSVGDSGQAFCNCILFCVRDRTVRTEIIRMCCGRSREGEPLLADDREDRRHINT